MKSRLTSKAATERVGSSTLIYVVDDEPALLDFAREILEAEGYSVKVFRDAGAALRCFRRSEPRPALILTDYLMAPMSGLALTRACRRIDPTQKVILLSGTADESVLETVRDRPNRHLAKPYGSGELRAAVQAMVGGLRHR